MLKRVTLRLTEDTHAWLADQAKQRKHGMSAVVDHAVMVLRMQEPVSTVTQRAVQAIAEAERQASVSANRIINSDVLATAVLSALRPVIHEQVAANNQALSKAMESNDERLDVLTNAIIELTGLLTNANTPAAGSTRPPLQF